MTYPDMVVEKRESTTAHGIIPPSQKGTGAYKEQLQDTIELCEGQQDGDWSPNVLRILRKYCPITYNENPIPIIMNALGFDSWKEVCDFVRDDECMEFMVRVAKFCKKMGFKVRKDRGFIDGEGFGLYRRYEDRCSRVMEKCFDVKYFYKESRPLEDLKEMTGVDFSCVSNYIHPGHFRFIAGHATKFYEAVDTALDTWEITKHYELFLIKGAYIASMGRSGILVHLPEDNIAAGALTGLKGFDSWKK